tara:strand:- start:61381 stop:61737 length:357 start_codon:yes stop_codon:yes gene_type:complete
MIRKKDLIHITKANRAQFHSEIPEKTVVFGNGIFVTVEHNLVAGKYLQEYRNSKDQEEHGKHKSQHKTEKKQNKVYERETGFHSHKDQIALFVKIVVQMQLFKRYWNTKGRNFCALSV